MQEPYVGAKAHVAIGSNFRVVQKITSDKKKPVRAAIVIVDPTIHFTVNPDLLDEDIVGIVYKVNNVSIGIISMYLDSKKNIEEDITLIKAYRRIMNTDDLIIGGDANASNLWRGCDADDQRGNALMETFTEMDCEIVNTGNTPTFYVYRQGKAHSSIIDVTACSSTLLPRVKRWRVDESFATLSDHRPILYEVDIKQQRRTNIRIGTKRFNTKKANWKKFKYELDQKITELNLDEAAIQEINSPEDLSKAVIGYTEAVISASRLSMPEIKTNTSRETQTWWNEDITNKRKEMITKRRRIKNANPRRKQIVIDEYLKAKEEFINAIEQTVTKSWKDLLTRQEKENVWQHTYRIIKATSNREEDKLLRASTGELLSETESAELLATTFDPADDDESDSVEQKAIRAKAANIKKEFANLPADTLLPFYQT
ncbi:endonuclease-reverse transcriptase domain-containing protein [Phthorimaea operculella]|nr:endonuclease-reverse transcriptase domain-containing protein [Phthorimaea operculella]